MFTSGMNTAWLLSNLPSYWRLKNSLSNPGETQERVLKSILRKNRFTAYGEKFGFPGITNSREFQNKVPVHKYEDYAHWINEIESGKTNVLTCESVTRLMPSSGSTSARKLIPYTRALQREFDRAIGAWIADLYLRTPRLISGPAYWSITPGVEHESQRGSVPIGYEQDTTYLGGFKKQLVDFVMAAPAALAGIKDIDAFRYLTLLALLRRRNLRLISVWHPSFLTLLIDELPSHWDSLLKDLNDGTVNPPGVVPLDLLEKLRAKPKVSRRKELERVTDTATVAIWPCLTLISCWGGGHAKAAINELRRFFPGVEIQQKGLIATEAFMSLPFGKDKMGRWLRPLAINSHFFEFADDNGNIQLADGLEQGREYQIIVTTSGGLYRYDMEDRVRVSGFAGKTPSIDFLGKVDSVTDFYGEKLNDQFVAGLLESLFQSTSTSISFSMLAPDGEPEPEHYTLYLEALAAPDIGLGARLEEKLCANPHYAECRRLGQLKRSRIFIISDSANKIYLLSSGAQGKRLGDIKPEKLSNRRDWSQVFHGTYL